VIGVTALRQVNASDPVAFKYGWGFVNINLRVYAEVKTVGSNRGTARLADAATVCCPMAGQLIANPKRSRLAKLG